MIASIVNIYRRSRELTTHTALGACILLILALPALAQDSVETPKTQVDSTIEGIFDSLVISDSTPARRSIRSNLSSLLRHQKTAIGNVELVWPDSATYIVDSLESGLTYVIRSNNYSMFTMVLFLKNSFTSSPPFQPIFDDYAIRYLTDFRETDFLGNTRPVDTTTRFKVYSYKNLRYGIANNTFDPAAPLTGLECYDSYAEYARVGFAWMFQSASRDSLDVAEVRHRQGNQQHEYYKSVQNVAAIRLFEKIRENQPSDLPPNRMPEVNKRTDSIELGYLVKRILSSDNLVVAVNTGLDSSRIVPLIRDAFKWVEEYDVDKMQRTLVLFQMPPDSTVLLSDDSTAAVAAGNEYVCSSDTGRINLQVACIILEDRIRRELMERKQIATSASCQISFTHDSGRYYFTVITNPQNQRAALSALALQVDKLGFDGPMVEELDTAVKEFWLKWQSNRRDPMSRMIYLAHDTYLNRPIPFEPHLLDILKETSIQSVRNAVARYMRTDNWITSGNVTETAD